jgi:spore germination cell wall hydrolase CwlJ-like protein
MRPFGDTIRHALRGLSIALAIGTVGAQAEVVVSGSNDPTAALDAQLATLIRVERSAVNAIPPARLSSMLAPARSAVPRQRPHEIRYEAEWLASFPPATGNEEWRCLAEAIYFEARGEGIRGQFAVAEVVMNRVDSARFPDTVCGVVRQGVGNGRGGCQFSYACDGKAERITEPAAFERAGKIARLMRDGAPRLLTVGATHFHTRAVKPLWSRTYARTAAIGAHLFYRGRGG